MRGVVLTTRRQLALAAGVAGCALWMGVCTAAMLANVVSTGADNQRVTKLKAYYERVNADRQARLNSAVAQLSVTNGSIDDLAQSVEKRHEALAMLLSDFRTPGALQAALPKPTKGETASQRVQAVRMDQERLIEQAENVAKTRAERLRLAFRLAGLDPGNFTRAGASSLGGPLIDAKDPRALAAVLDVDEGFAERIQHAATDMSDMRSLNQAVEKLPFARPTSAPQLSSSYGVRLDPFTHRPAFHSGLDFPGAFLTPIYATAPGVVSFTGERSGYGQTVEIDHGGGFKTRYAHLAAISVGVGQRVGIGARVGAMGSTGRSTGPHQHYEVWGDGRPQNPDRFVKAGDYVQQTAGPG